MLRVILIRFNKSVAEKSIYHKVHFQTFDKNIYIYISVNN